MQRSLTFALAFLVCGAPTIALADEPVDEDAAEEAGSNDVDDESGTDVTVCDNAVTIHSTCDQKTVVVVEKPVIVEKRVVVEKEVYVPRRKKLRPIEGEDPPEGYREVMKSRSGIWGPGIGVLGASYLYSVLISTLATDDGWAWGFVPVFGALGVASSTRDAGWAGALVAMGLGQAAGLSMIIGGASAKRPIWVMNQYAKSDGPKTELVASPGWSGVKVSF
ncbi:MAG: hypothetical protein U0271_24050 [Polyangiaceae bacterium]